MLTLESFRAHWQFSQNDSLVVALSGGIDSIVLLHLLTSLRDQGSDFALRAIHVNHHLCDASDEWEQYCNTLCVSWGVTFNAYSVNVNRNSGLGIEAAARLARYQSLDEHCLSGECLLTAHHQMDQVETLLLRLIRGSGIKGLSAMSVQSSFNQRDILRPLLVFSKESIEQYARNKQLTWVEDTSNQDMAIDRNYLRYHVLPVFQKRWPKVLQTMARSSRHCFESNLLLEDYLSQDLMAIKQGDLLSVKGLNLMPAIKQGHLLRSWLIEQDCPIPDTHQLESMISCVVHAKSDAMPCLHWKGYELRRYDDWLYVMPRLISFDSSIEYTWNLQDDLLIESLGLVLPVESKAVQDIQQRYRASQLTVRFRRGGERLKMDGYHQTLSKYFQQTRVPPWLRDRIPLLFLQDELVSVWLSDIGNED